MGISLQSCSSAELQGQQAPNLDSFPGFENVPPSSLCITWNSGAWWKMHVQLYIWTYEYNVLYIAQHTILFAFIKSPSTGKLALQLGISMTHRKDVCNHLHKCPYPSALPAPSLLSIMPNQSESETGKWQAVKYFRSVRIMFGSLVS